nr:peptidyl-dipeptidase A inhibitory peptide C105 - striped bonito [Sarda orientalis]
SVAKLEK